MMATQVRLRICQGPGVARKTFRGEVGLGLGFEGWVGAREAEWPPVEHSRIQWTWVNLDQRWWRSSEQTSLDGEMAGGHGGQCAIFWEVLKLRQRCVLPRATDCQLWATVPKRMMTQGYLRKLAGTDHRGRMKID